MSDRFSPFRIETLPENIARKPGHFGKILLGCVVALIIFLSYAKDETSSSSLTSSLLESLKDTFIKSRTSIPFNGSDYTNVNPGKVLIDEDPIVSSRSKKGYKEINVNEGLMKFEDMKNLRNNTKTYIGSEDVETKQALWRNINTFSNV